METYNGHVRTPADAILLFEACRIGLLPRVQRRLSEKERQQIKSGSVFVWDEREAGMRRWTDGKSWSASRVSGSFLTYREMEGKRGGSFPAPAPAPKRPSGKSPDGSATGDSDGEGPDGYRYKPDGLMKQSFSITTSSGQHLHLISYFSRSHPTSAGLAQPTQDPQLRHIRPPKNMYPESSVNETTNVPAVTRGPMPNSPYAGPTHQIGSPSHFSRPPPGAPPGPPGYIPVNYGPPTPPYQYFYGAPPNYPPVVFYAPPGYHHQGPAYAERGPPHMASPHPPAAAGYYAPHPQNAFPPAQHVQHAPPRAVQAPGNPHHSPQPNGQQPAHHHVPASSAQIPEQGPQLPAINGAAHKSTTPQPSEPKQQESLIVPETNGAPPANAPSPTRIPNIRTLLNDSTANTTTNVKSTSRSGSRSPSGSQWPPSSREILNNTSRGILNGSREMMNPTDDKAIKMLDSMAMSA